MATTDLPKPDYIHNMRVIGHSDQGGRPDAVQVMVNKGHAYVGHLFSQGFSVIDVQDPTRPRFVEYFPCPENTWNLHLQAHDDLLLVVHAKNMWAQPELADERNYYKGSADFHAHSEASGARNWSAGLAVYDISKPAKPRRIGFMPVDGGGLHRAWYVGGRWAYASALIEGFSDYIFIIIDMADPAHPREAGRFWLPGMNLAAGEKPNWPTTTGRYGCHHGLVHGDTAWCAWRDANLVVVDLKDRTAPKLITHKSWSPPFGGGTHNCLPLPDRDLLLVLDEAVLDGMEDGMKPIWVFDNRLATNPVSIATFPLPSDRDYIKVGGHFGPHNVYENRPGNFISSDIIFTTYQNAGVRVFDIRDPYQPKEIAGFAPAPPTRLIDPRPNRPLVL
ncbi:MAG: LVIVD repeat-containing protein, partial [Acetobacteraceae bacterium]